MGIDVTSIKTRISTHLFEESRSFYIEVVGMQMLDSWEDGEDIGCILGFASVTDSGFLELARSDKDSSTQAGNVSLQFRTEDISEAVKHLDGRWPYVGPDKRPWGSTYVYLKDPNGVEVIVFQGDL